MYRILLLCKDTAILSPMIQSYFRMNTHDSLELFVVGVEATAIHPEVTKFLTSEKVSLEAIESHRLEDFQGINFDYILTFDPVAKKASHQLSSHPVKYHYDLDTNAAKLSAATCQKLYQKLNSILNEFIEEHF